MKKALTIFVLLLWFNNAFGQKMRIDYYIRLPHLVNYNFTNGTSSYTPAISSGITLNLGGLFADVGAYIDDGDSYGYYTYFGSALFRKPIDEQWNFTTNWFGESSFSPPQSDIAQSWNHTVGISPVLVRPLSWGTFAVALTVGAAFNKHTTSLNTRLIINYAIPLHK